MSPIRIRLLGDFDVRWNGLELPIPAGQQRAVLVVLALRAGQPVPVESIADKLWDRLPPQGSRTTIRGYVGRLRRVLDEPGAESLIGTAAGGYRLRVDPADVDVHRFTELLVQARAARDVERELRCLEDALGCWRGAAFEGVNCESLDWQARPALDEQYLQAVQRRLDIIIERCGDGPEEAVAELRGLVAEHPLRERFWAQLMHALHRANRSAEALHVYEDCRATLSAELGVDPGSELRELHGVILRGGPGTSRLPRLEPTITYEIRHKAALVR